MKLNKTLLYKYEFSNNPLKYKSTVNFFPRKLNQRIAKYILLPEEFNSIIKACIEVEKSILFLLYEQNESFKIQDLTEETDKRSVLKSDYIINFIKNKVNYLKNFLNEYINEEAPKLNIFKEKIDEINFENQYDYQISVFKSYVNFLIIAIDLYKNYLIYLNIMADENFTADYNSLEKEYNKLSKKILLNFLKIKLKISYLNKKLEIIQQL